MTEGRDGELDPAPAPDGASASDRHLAVAFHHAPTGVVVARPDGIITACNHAAGHLLGGDPVDLLGADLFDVVHPGDRPEVERRWAQLPAAGATVLHHECRLRRAPVVWVSLSVSPVPEGRARPGCLVVHVEDVTERRRREAELNHQARHDPLTGLPNRALLIERIREALTGHPRRAGGSHLFYLDLNGFKEVNDRFGHVVGDAVLIQFAHRIAALLGAGDTAARLGGDEFAVLCEDIEPRCVAAVAERLRAAAAEPFRVNDAEIVLSVAVGGSPACAADPVALLREADRRMYETKRRVVLVPVPEPRGGPGTRDDHRVRTPVGGLALGERARTTPTD